MRRAPAVPPTKILEAMQGEITDRLRLIANEIYQRRAPDYRWPGSAQNTPAYQSYLRQLKKVVPKSRDVWEHLVTHELSAGPNYLPNYYTSAAAAAAPARAGGTITELTTELAMVRRLGAPGAARAAALSYVRLINRAHEYHRQGEGGRALQDLDRALAACVALENNSRVATRPGDCPGAFARPVIYWAQNIVLAERKNYPAAARAARRILTVNNKHFRGTALRSLPGYLDSLAQLTKK